MRIIRKYLFRGMFEARDIHARCDHDDGNAGNGSKSVRFNPDIPDAEGQWKGRRKISYPYVVTANTKLEFDFMTTQQGEIQAIGLDADNVQDSDYFELYGTDISGRENCKNCAGGGVGTHYVIRSGGYTPRETFRVHE